jgi:hypothetical protein
MECFSLRSVFASYPHQEKGVKILVLKETSWLNQEVQEVLGSTRKKA